MVLLALYFSTKVLLIFFSRAQFLSFKKKKAQLVSRAGDGLDQLDVLAVVGGALSFAGAALLLRL